MLWVQPIGGGKLVNLAKAEIVYIKREPNIKQCEVIVELPKRPTALLYIGTEEECSIYLGKLTERMGAFVYEEEEDEGRPVSYTGRA